VTSKPRRVLGKKTGQIFFRAEDVHALIDNAAGAVAEEEQS